MRKERPNEKFDYDDGDSIQNLQFDKSVKVWSQRTHFD